MSAASPARVTPSFLAAELGPSRWIAPRAVSDRGRFRELLVNVLRQFSYLRREQLADPVICGGSLKP